MKTIVTILATHTRDTANNAVRQTWGRELVEHGIEIIFIFPSTHEYIDGDSLYVDHPDGFDQITGKMLKGFRWLLKHREFDYIFTCDDNTYVHPKRWLAFTPTGDLIGQTHYKPDWWWVHGGAGYFQSRRLTELLCESCGIGNLDGLVSTVAVENGIEIQSCPLFSNFPKPMTDGLITQHYIGPEEMIANHAAWSSL